MSNMSYHELFGRKTSGWGDVKNIFCGSFLAYVNNISYFCLTIRFRKATWPMEDDDNMRNKAGEKEEHGLILEERPDYYVRKSRKGFWVRCMLFTMACILLTFVAYRVAVFVKSYQPLPRMGEDEPSLQVSYVVGQGTKADEAGVAKRLETIYDDMLGSSRPHALTYLSSDFKQVMMNVFRAEKECGCTLLDHDLWTRTTGIDFTMQLKSVTMTSDDRASADLTVTGQLGHYFNQASLVVSLLFEHGQWVVDDMVTSNGSEKVTLRQKAEEVLSTLREEENLNRVEEVSNDAPVHTLKMRGTIADRKTVAFNMYLTISQGSVTGEYDQTNGDGARYVLTGQIEGDGTMVLQEYKNGMSSGRFFEGRLEGDAYKGKYKNSSETTDCDFNAYLQ